MKKMGLQVNEMQIFWRKSISANVKQICRF